MGFKDFFTRKTKIKSQPDDYYKIDPFAGTPFSRPVVVYDDAIKKSWKTPSGLYPPEIVAIYFCNIHPNPKTGYPAWYWFRYGIRDVEDFQRKLESKGLIEKTSDGKWIPSKKGEQELKENEFIVWAHQNNDIDGIDAWSIGKVLDDAPEGAKKMSWRDKIWGYMNNYYLHEQHAGSRRNMRFNMAKFLYQDQKYADALRLLDEVIEIDKKSGDFNDIVGGSPLVKLRGQWERKAERAKS